MNTARVLQEDPRVKYAADLAELEELRHKRPIGCISTDYITAKYGIHHYDPVMDKLAKQMWMPRGLRPKNAAFGTGSTRRSETASTAEKSSKKVSKKPTLTLVKQNMKVETRQHGITKETDLIDGRAFGKKIVTIRRKQGKRSCQHIGKRLFEIAKKNIGRGSLFYLSAGYGILESR